MCVAVMREYTHFLPKILMTFLVIILLHVLHVLDQWRSQGGHCPLLGGLDRENIIVESIVHTAELDVLCTQKVQIYA